MRMPGCFLVALPRRYQAFSSPSLVVIQPLFFQSHATTATVVDCLIASASDTDSPPLPPLHRLQRHHRRAEERVKGKARH